MSDNGDYDGKNDLERLMYETRRKRGSELKEQEIRLGFDLEECLRETSSAWHQKAIDHVKAFFTRRSYMDVLAERVRKKVDNKLAELQEYWTNVAEGYRKQQERLAELSQEAKELQNAKTVKPAKGLDVKEMEKDREWSYVQEDMAICKEIIAVYESTLSKVNLVIGEMTRQKIRFEANPETAGYFKPVTE